MRARELQKLRKEFGVNKQIPAAYEALILRVLSFYPELKRTHIRFRFKKKCPVPYGTKPAFLSVFKGKSKRIYVMTFRTEAKPPTLQALFHNLPEEAQRAVVAHELGHVLQYESMALGELLGVALKLALSSSFRSKFESTADRLAIEHGLGKELFVHATHIRNIPGYLEKRKSLDKNYLTPKEILRYITVLRFLPEDDSSAVQAG